MLHHRPHAGNIPRREQNLPVVSAENLVAEIEKAGRDIDPHEGEVPLQRPAQPAADGEGLRPMQQIFLRNLRAETGEGAENLQPAAHHHKQRNRIQPMAEPHDERDARRLRARHNRLVVLPCRIISITLPLMLDLPTSFLRLLVPLSRRVDVLQLSTPVKARIALIFPVPDFSSTCVTFKSVKYFACL